MVPSIGEVLLTNVCFLYKYRYIIIATCRRGVMAAAVDSKSTGSDTVWVQVPSPAP